VSERDRGLIEGLTARDAESTASFGLSEEQAMSRAVYRLSADPPPQVGMFQRRTASWLLRPYPLGLRFSGNNMSPIPGWLAGAQSAALNMTNVDCAIHLHFALFNGTEGYALKPLEMRVSPSPVEKVQLKTRESFTLSAIPEDKDKGGSLCADRPGNREDYYWPLPRQTLHRISVEILSLHNLPKRGEQRPRFDGRRQACHKYHTELSGMAIPPNHRDPSSPALSLSLHPIGGFCAISQVLPLQPNPGREIELPCKSNGMNTAFGETIHCVAAEPHTTFLRIFVSDGGQQVAFESAVLGRLRHGYRVFQLRSLLGTRIELCHLFVKISVGDEPNLWSNPRQIRLQSILKRNETQEMREENSKLKEELAILKGRVVRLPEENVNSVPSGDDVYSDV